MSLKPAIDLLMQREMSVKSQIKSAQEDLNEKRAQVSELENSVKKLEDQLASSQEALQVLEKLELSKKELKNDTNQDKKTTRKSSTPSKSN